MSASFSGLVDAGMTAMNGRSRKRAKYASETAVDPLEASRTVVRSVIQPLHNPYRNSDRASRGFSDAVGWTNSSFRYRSIPHSGGSGNACRCVSAERLSSASMRRTASLAHSLEPWRSRLVPGVVTRPGRRRSWRERDPFPGDLGEVAVRAIRSLERLLELLPAQAEQVDVADRAHARRPSCVGQDPDLPEALPP